MINKISTRDWIPVGLILGLLSLSGCVQRVAIAERSDGANDATTVAAVNKWWQDFTYSSEPVKAGTMTPAHTITSKKGRVYNIPKHIQSKQEAAEEAEDSRFMATKRALVRGFSVRGHTLVVITSISPDDTNAAKEICQNMGAFVYANPNRHFGLTNISVLGANGIEVSARIGLSGKAR